MSRDDVSGQEHLHARRVALAKAFATLAGRWSQRFAASKTGALLPVWLIAVEGIPVEQIEPMAIQFTAKFEGKYPPSPQDFAQWVRGSIRRATGDAPASAHEPRRSRVWEWNSPITGRFSRAERHESGEWVWFAIDDAEAFYGYGDDARVEYCEAMSTAHPLNPKFMRGAA